MVVAVRGHLETAVELQLMAVHECNGWLRTVQSSRRVEIQTNTEHSVVHDDHHAWRIKADSFTHCVGLDSGVLPGTQDSAFQLCALSAFTAADSRERP